MIVGRLYLDKKKAVRKTVSISAAVLVYVIRKQGLACKATYFWEQEVQISYVL